MFIKAEIYTERHVYIIFVVTAAPRRGCRPSASQPGVNPLPLTTSPEGVIASVVTSESGCGSHVAPWRLQASDILLLKLISLSLVLQSCGNNFNFRSFQF